MHTGTTGRRPRVGVSAAAALSRASEGGRWRASPYSSYSSTVLLKKSTEKGQNTSDGAGGRERGERSAIYLQCTVVVHGWARGGV